MAVEELQVSVGAVTSCFEKKSDRRVPSPRILCDSNDANNLWKKISVPARDSSSINIEINLYSTNLNDLSGIHGAVENRDLRH